MLRRDEDVQSFSVKKEVRSIVAGSLGLCITVDRVNFCKVQENFGCFPAGTGELLL